MGMFNTSMSSSSVLVLISMDTYRRVQYEGFCLPQLLLFTSIFFFLFAGPMFSISGASRVFHWVNSPKPTNYFGTLSETQATWGDLLASRVIVGWSENTMGLRMTALQSEAVVIMISQAVPQIMVPLKFL